MTCTTDRPVTASNNQAIRPLPEMRFTFPGLGLTRHGGLILKPAISGGPMRKLLFILLLLCVTTWVSLVWISPVWGDSENIEPDATGSPDDWSNQGGASKVASVTDDVDDNYIYEHMVSENQRFSLSNPSGISGDDTIDSVRIAWRAKETGTNSTMHMELHYDGNQSNGSIHSLSDTWGNKKDTFNEKPSGGSWTLAAVNSLEVEADPDAIDFLQSIKVTYIYLIVYYTPVSEVTGRRRTVIIKGD